METARKVEFIIRGKESEKKIVELYLKRTEMGISLMAEDSGKKSQWYIVSLSPEGNLILHEGIDKNLGFQTGHEGEILIIKETEV